MARVSASRESDSGSSILKRYPIVQSQNYILPGAPLLAFFARGGRWHHSIYWAGEISHVMSYTHPRRDRSTFF
jgi:hypothetical protein